MNSSEKLNYYNLFVIEQIIDLMRKLTPGDDSGFNGEDKYKALEFIYKIESDLRSLEADK